MLINNKIIKMNLICPDCSVELNKREGMCCKCGWKLKFKGRVIVCLGNKDHEDPVLKSYFENYDQIAVDDLHESILDEAYIKIQAEKICRLVPDLKNKHVCDIGSGKGYLARALLAKAPKSVTVVDISEDYLKRFEEPIIPVQANAENLPFKEEFDVITCTDILEHILNPGSFLYSLNRSLKKDGIALIRVPYKENLLWYSPHMGCKYQFVHLRNFSKDNLKCLVEGGGFKALRFSFDGYWLYAPKPLFHANRYIKFFYEKSCAIFKKFIPNHVVAINNLPHFLVNIVLQPKEIVIVAKKTETL